MRISILRYSWIIVVFLAVFGGFVFLSKDLSEEISDEGILEEVPPPERAVVDDIIDAMTVKLDSGQVVRYIGISVPDSRAVVECYGKESLLANESMIGKSVRLEDDPVLLRARDGAWLRYVFTDEVKRKPVEKEGDDAADVASNEPNNSSEEVEKEAGEDVKNRKEEEAEYEEEVSEYMVNERMIERGYAIPLLSQQMKYYSRLASAARYSNATRKGLWGACEIKEGENGLLKTEEVDDDCVIKGIDLGESQRVYRTKECLAYENSVVIQSHGDRWLCSEEKAEEDGWQKASDCP